jgi:uncharacterized membrane protein
MALELEHEAERAKDVASKDPIARLIEKQGWITPEVEKGVQKAIGGGLNAIGGKPLRDFLHGNWLHEPLHAVITDVPVGSWTATVAFDAVGALTGSTKLDTAADAALVVGLIGAVGASVTGMNDWAEVKKANARKIGLVHATLNTVGAGLFIASLVARRKKARSTGRSLAALAYLFTSVSAHLGGNLIYEHKIGVREDW